MTKHEFFVYGLSFASSHLEVNIYFVIKKLRMPITRYSLGTTPIKLCLTLLLSVREGNVDFIELATNHWCV